MGGDEEGGGTAPKAKVGDAEDAADAVGARAAAVSGDEDGGGAAPKEKVGEAEDGGGAGVL